MDRGQLAYWEARSHDWQVAPPLWPVRADIAWYEARAREAAAAAGRPLRVLLLGVTPGIATMLWPAGALVVAVDWSEGMIRRVWPKKGAPKAATALCADWRELPLSASSMDMAIGDNSASALPTPADATLHFREVARVLRPGGVYCGRCFCRVDPPPTEAELFEELFSGRIRNLDLFRLLLAMSVQGASSQGVRLNEVWRIWSRRVPNPAALRARYGWTEKALANFAVWRDHDGRHNFPSATEVAELAARCFELVTCEAPPYPVGRHFPRLVLRVT